MSQPAHPLELVHALHDGRLSAEERIPVEAHLAGCSSCRSELDALRAVTSALAQGPATSVELEARLRRMLDGEDARVRWWRASRRWWVGGAAAAVLVALLVLVARRPREPDWPLLAVRAQAELEDGRFTLDVLESVPEVLERQLRARGATVRVLDLAMMGFRVMGGAVREAAGRRVAIVVYRDERGRILLCQMFPGADVRLPPPAEERRDGAILFSVYPREGRTAVFWREGSVLCGLVWAGPREEVIALAVAKARQP